jgi:hypothetical protein
MKLRSLVRNGALRRTAGYTIVELVMASFIALLVLGALMMLLLQMGTEQKYSLTDALLQSQAGLTQDMLAQKLRSMSVTESAIFTDSVSGKPGCYRSIIVARGQTPVYPREAIYFNSTNFTLIHDPNRNVANDQIILYKPDGFVVLRDLYFYPSLKTGNVTDGTAVNVVMLFDDDGYSTRKGTNGVIKRTSIYRYFTIKFRNG